MALANVPTLTMLTAASDTIKKKGQAILRRLGGATKQKNVIELRKTESKVGGGAMPEHGLASWALVLHPKSGKAATLEKQLRSRDIPIIGRIEDEKMILDLRTIQEGDIPVLVDMLKAFSDKCED